MLGLETAFAVVHDLMVRSGRMTMSDLVRRMSIDPARIAGLTEHGRSIAVGNPANLVVIDPERAVTVDAAVSNSLSRNNPWHGMSFTGAVHATICAAGSPPRREGSRPVSVTTSANDTAVLVLEGRAPLHQAGLRRPRRPSARPSSTPG